MDFLRSLMVGIMEAWKRLSTNARVQIVLAAALTLAILIGVMLFGSQPQFVNLATRLDPSEADDMIVWLNEQDIPYRQREGGRSLQVPVGDVPRARVGLAGQGLPRSQGDIPGFEQFDTQSLMTNKWMQDTKFMIAVQGSLQRNLNQFEFVEQSVVFIHSAPDRLFSADQTPSEASVTLKVKYPLTNQEVAAVLHTVSSYGGSNLTPKNITITDTTGKVYKMPDADDSISIANGQLDILANLTSFYERKVQSALTAMGHNVIVTASAYIDWNSVEKHERTLGEEGLVISSQESTSETTTGEGPPEGSPGALANIPGGDVIPGSIQTKTETSDTTENFEIPETSITTITPPGMIKSLSIGVVVDHNLVEELDADGNATGQFTLQAPTDEEIAVLEELVRSTVAGAAETITVSLAHYPFKTDRLALAGAAPILGSLPFYQQGWFRLIAQGAFVVIAFILIRVFMSRALSVPTIEEEEVVEIPEATKEDMRRMEIASEVERLSREEPEAVAALLRSWMSEED